MGSLDGNIIGGFVQSATRFPERAAVRLSGKEYSYRHVYKLSSSVAGAITENLARSGRQGDRLVVVFANRTLSGLVGIASALLSGRGYVPVNPAFPPERIRYMLEVADCSTIIAEPDSLEYLLSVVKDSERQYLIIVPELDDAGVLAGPFEKHRIIGKSGLAKSSDITPPDVRDDDLAYVMFTSGSTGRPKGVMTTHASMRWVLEILDRRYGITEEDRLALNADLSFSASVLVIFLAFNRGATICYPTKRDLMSPARFIIEEGITFWKSVPSVPAFMSKLNQLKEGSFPSIRLTTFGGEPVPVRIMEEWSKAAPNSVLEVVYGLTEFTVNTSFFEWKGETHHGVEEHEIVPIGHVFDGAEFLVCNDDLEEVHPGEVGELLVSGPHISPGYYNDAERTQQLLVVPRNSKRVFGRSGDLVRRPMNNGPLRFVGRKDNQIKVLGNRVELGEIESIAAGTLDTLDVIALGWHPTDRGYDGIALFVAGTGLTEPEILQRLKGLLAPYMMPQKICLLETLPLNASGKKDRLTLKKMLEEMT